MRMQVDEAGRRELAARVEHSQPAIGGDLALEGLDTTEADADVAPAAQVLARVENVGVLDHEVELVLRPDLRERPGERGSGDCERASAQETASVVLVHGALL